MTDIETSSDLLIKDLEEIIRKIKTEGYECGLYEIIVNDSYHLAQAMIDNKTEEYNLRFTLSK